MKRKWLSQPRKKFILDGNRKAFTPPIYEPLVDKNLIGFHYEHGVFSKLKSMHVLNRRYEIVDNDIRKRILQKSNLSHKYSNRKLNLKNFYRYSNMRHPERAWVMNSPTRRLFKNRSTLSRENFIRYIEKIRTRCQADSQP